MRQTEEGELLAKKLETALLLSFALWLNAPMAIAVQSSCPEYFFDGQAPEITNPKLAQKTSHLCNPGYSVLYSALAKDPLTSAEHLTRRGLAQGRAIVRQDHFRADTRIPIGSRSELTDYKGTIFDRGHNFPFRDADTDSAADASFLLTNIVPQSRIMNRGVWEQIEAATRHLANQLGEIFVVTGSLFQPDSNGKIQAIGRNRVLVPSHMFKAIYSPSTQTAAAYLCPNTDTGTPSIISLQDLERYAGINLFPGVNQDVKARAMTLPEPRPYKDRR